MRSPLYDSAALLSRRMPPSEHVPPAHLSQLLAVYTSSSFVASNHQSLPRERIAAHSTMSRNDDNTAAGMALSQEDSMYLTPVSSPDAFNSEDKENYHTPQDENKMDEDILKHNHRSDDITTQDMLLSPPSSVRSFALQSKHSATTDNHSHSGRASPNTKAETDEITQDETCPAVSPGAEETSPIPKGLAKVDLEMDLASDLKSWDFSDKTPSSRTPSAMLQPYAKFVGTQQSGNHTYNVEVTILTVNMDQSELSGFLKISDLTPEHPVLETFFTGEIVGGPNQRYSFRTMDPAWGTNEKVDMRHWMRFPAWRQFSSIAKRDMSFEYPLNGQAWYQQEHIFMRWKERFLAPDHKKSNLSGASFEGFYYTCLNQMEGKISGVYFHSHSEQ